MVLFNNNYCVTNKRKHELLHLHFFQCNFIHNGYGNEIYKAVVPHAVICICKKGNPPIVSIVHSIAVVDL